MTKAKKWLAGLAIGLALVGCTGAMVGCSGGSATLEGSYWYTGAYIWFDEY